MMRQKAILIILFFSTLEAFAVVSSPQVRCVSVLANGNVTLTWSTPADPGNEFNAYMIYKSNFASGPFVAIDSIFTYGQQSYLNTSANAATTQVYYYIQTRYTNAGLFYAPPLDTVSSIHLNLVNPGNGTALLSWNPISTPLVSTSSGVYTIYEEYPAGVWSVTGTTSNLNFLDTIFVCNAAINYRIAIADNTGCTSVSSVTGGTFQNIIVPDIPVIDTLSVDNNNDAMMNWNTNPSPDIVAYIIYKSNGPVWIPVDTIFGQNNTNYTYLLSNAGAGSEQYRLAAFDSCGNISPLGTIYSTLFLSSSANICQRSAALSWTPYLTIGNGLEGYHIYQSTVGLSGPYTSIAILSPTTLTYTVTGLTPSTTYYFKIEAFDNSGVKTVSSNRILFYSATPIPPMYSYLRKATVVSASRVDITCHVDVAAAILGYKIMRSNDTITANFKHIGTVPSGTGTPILYSDNKALPDKNSYYYKVITVDSCGNDGLETNLGRTMFLNARSNSDLTNTLTWNDYEYWSGGVSSYNIYRGIDGAMDPSPIANVFSTNSGTNSYLDDVSIFLNGEGVFNYYIEALEGNGNVYGFAENSLSNVAEAYQEPKVFIPNAFRPEGFNSVFIPVTTYVNFSEYEFTVFNSWGLQMFSTKNNHEGWNGTHGGQKCELGVYVYLVKYKTSKGEYIELKGAVTLIR